MRKRHASQYANFGSLPEWDEEIFYYCNSRNELKSLTEKGCSDFVIADCFGFGMYEKPIQEI